MSLISLITIIHECRNRVLAEFQNVQNKNNRLNFFYNFFRISRLQCCAAGRIEDKNVNVDD
jgi:hypothetical protein